MQDSLLQRITINPAVCHGKPTIRNKRYPVENMLELMASGMTNEEILADYEDLEIEDLRALSAVCSETGERRLDYRANCGMKFIVDAHLPKALAFLLREKGFDAIHTTELPEGNDTTDAEINRLSLAENRIVVSKDADFYDSYTAKKEPYKLLHIITGNIKNSQLIELLEAVSKI